MFNNFSKRATNTLRKQSLFFRYYCIEATKSKPAANNRLPKCSVKSFGQPTSATHPHLVRNGEVTPLIQRSEFQARRQRLVETIATRCLKTNADLKRHLIVFPSATKQYMSDKIPYVFRQNSDFLYLSGCQEPDSCLVLATTDSPSQHCVILFVREKDPHSELWDGPRTGVEEAVNLFGVDQALPMSELENYLRLYMKSNRSSTLWYDYISPIQKTVNTVMQDFLNETVNKMWESPTNFVHKLRLIKSDTEIELMQKSCDIASQAIKNTIAASRPGISEHEIFAKVDYECRVNGAEFLAYPPVVAGGDRANIIHYINNSQVVQDGEMVLMDAGCEYHGYSSDITRTWPINGHFTAQQKALYEAVLDVQGDLINLCQEFPSLDFLFDSMCTLLGKRLQDIGLVARNAPNDVLFKTAYQFCPHHVSHYLGMDVHDTPSIPRSIKLEPGMIVTIEPGIYINYKHKAPREFQGLGVRIEDDVLITKEGPVVLTKKCPKQLSEIEQISQSNL